MMDPREFKAPFIKIEEIGMAVAGFRSRYWLRDTIPVDIFEIVEFELGIEIRTIFNLREASDVDALLLGDLKTISSVVKWRPDKSPPFHTFYASKPL